VRRDPLHRQEPTLGITRILVRIHPDDLPISAAGIATASLARMSNLQTNRTWWDGC
jgi:hypothetical protein